MKYIVILVFFCNSYCYASQLKRVESLTRRTSYFAILKNMDNMINDQLDSQMSSKAALDKEFSKKIREILLLNFKIEDLLGSIVNSSLRMINESQVKKIEHVFDQDNMKYMNRLYDIDASQSFIKKLSDYTHHLQKKPITKYRRSIINTIDQTTGYSDFAHYASTRIMECLFRSFSYSQTGSFEHEIIGKIIGQMASETKDLIKKQSFLLIAYYNRDKSDQYLVELIKDLQSKEFISFNEITRKNSILALDNAYDKSLLEIKKISE